MTKYFWVFGLIIIVTSVVLGDTVDSKLDLEETTVKTSTHRNATNSSSTNTKTSSPKIKGVRVTVDTAKIPKSKETDSNESIEIVDRKSTKSKKIGIHTDITFEIDADEKDDSNGTSSGSDDQDASVPVFKGHDRTTTKRPLYHNKKPYDPRDQSWTPSHQYPDSGSRFYPNYHHQPPSRIPPAVYPRTRDYDIYRNDDNWSSYVPVKRVWTTERNYYPSHNVYHHGDQTNTAGFTSYYEAAPQHHSHYLSSSSSAQRDDGDWTPCYCISETTYTGWKSKRHSNIDSNVRISKLIPKVNNKLDNPFSSAKRK